MDMRMIHCALQEGEVSVADYATVCTRKGGEDVTFRVYHIVSPHLLKVRMGAQDGLGVFEIKLRDIHKECERIHQPALEKHFVSYLFREILVKE